jgi:heptose I phosphotransferase
MADNTFWLREDIAGLIGDKNPFDFFSKLEGEVFRALEFRRTFAVELGDKRYFVKHHSGSSVGEILKNLLQLRLPIISAENEILAIKKLAAQGITVPTIAAYGRRGLLPNAIESFIVTEDVGTQENLEDVTRNWPNKEPAFAEKVSLIRKVSEISARMHNSGICHRDFYLCHFMAPFVTEGQEENHLILIDLHRALVKKHLGQRWVIKDIAGLYFSAMDIGLSRRDLFRFIRMYSGNSLRVVLEKEAAFWQKVERRALKMKKKHS